MRLTNSRIVTGTDGIDRIVTRDESIAIDSKDFKTTAVKRRYVTRHKIGFYELNGYSLGCGYLQVVKVGESRSLTLWRENERWHVRYCDFERNSEGISDAEGFYRVWRTFSTLFEARKEFASWLPVIVTYVDVLGLYDQKWEVVTTEPSVNLSGS